MNRAEVERAARTLQTYWSVHRYAQKYISGMSETAKLLQDRPHPSDSDETWSAWGVDLQKRISVHTQLPRRLEPMYEKALKEFTRSAQDFKGTLEKTPGAALLKWPLWERVLYMRSSMVRDLETALSENSGHTPEVIQKLRQQVEEEVINPENKEEITKLLIEEAAQKTMGDQELKEQMAEEVVVEEKVPVKVPPHLKDAYRSRNPRILKLPEILVEDLSGALKVENEKVEETLLVILGEGTLQEAYQAAKALEEQ